MTDFDEIMEEARQWRASHPWRRRWYGLRRRLRRARVVAAREPRWAWQRARHGYSRRDLWSFDTYIAGVIGRACIDLRDTSHGYPNGLTEEEWANVLTGISEPLLEYSEHKFADLTREEGQEQYEAARSAMQWFACRLGDMWD